MPPSPEESMAHVSESGYEEAREAAQEAIPHASAGEIQDAIEAAVPLLLAPVEAERDEAERKAFDQHVMVGESHTQIEELRSTLARDRERLAEAETTRSELLDEVREALRRRFDEAEKKFLVENRQTYRDFFSGEIQALNILAQDLQLVPESEERDV